MASAAMTVNVHLRRLGPFLAWMRLATRLVRCGLTPERTVAIGNYLLGWARIDCRSVSGRLLTSQPFPGRLVIEDAGTLSMDGWG